MCYLSRRTRLTVVLCAVQITWHILLATRYLRYKREIIFNGLRRCRPESHFLTTEGLHRHRSWATPFTIYLIFSKHEIYPPRILKRVPPRCPCGEREPPTHTLRNFAGGPGQRRCRPGSVHGLRSMATKGAESYPMLRSRRRSQVSLCPLLVSARLRPGMPTCLRIWYTSGVNRWIFQDASGATEPPQSNPQARTNLGHLDRSKRNGQTTYAESYPVPNIPTSHIKAPETKFLPYQHQNEKTKHLCLARIPWVDGQQYDSSHLTTLSIATDDGPCRFATYTPDIPTSDILRGYGPRPLDLADTKKTD